ncbi:hypothetical protein DFH09DRAFT_1300166 [Mycena vulgaris]|nr:hypothetical protein DFH09DRAFT_1300166 [Mycena vulgaris]
MLRVRLAKIDAEMEDLQAKLLDRLAEAREPALRSIVYHILTILLEATAGIVIEYHRPTPGSPPFSQYEKLLECWLSRAGSLPLDLDLSPLRTYRVFTALAPYFGESRSLSCALPSSLQLKAIQGCRPLLKRLTVLRHGGNLPSPFTAFSEATQLRELTHFQCWGYSPPQCVEILRHTRNLEPLLLGLTDSFSVTRLAPLYLNHLHTLKFFLDMGPRPKLNILAAITVPALKHLAIAISEAALSKLRALLDRSGCQ